MTSRPPQIPRARYRDENGEWEPGFHPVAEMLVLFALLAGGIAVVWALFSGALWLIRKVWDLI